MKYVLKKVAELPKRGGSLNGKSKYLRLIKSLSKRRKGDIIKINILGITKHNQVQSVSWGLRCALDAEGVKNVQICQRNRQLFAVVK